MLLITLCSVLAAICHGSVADSNEFVMTIRMPNATSEAPDALVCHAHKLPEREAYIVRFEPHASMLLIHHMMVYGCSLPGKDKPFWSCPFEEKGMDVCGEGTRQIVFAWANDAPTKALPEGVGFRVGGTTGINYLVIQLHYSKSFGADAADNSGVTLQMTYDRPAQQAGYYVLGNVGIIPPQEPAFLMESACSMELNYTIYPIGYRTHGHNIAVVTSGYLVRDRKWIQLGRMSPQRPQTFYNVTTPGVEVNPGDILAARCTFNSMSRTEPTQIGPTNHDEMCNFYILYSTYEQEDLSIAYCFQQDSFKWRDYLDTSLPPTPALLAAFQALMRSDTSSTWIPDRHFCVFFVGKICSIP